MAICYDASDVAQGYVVYTLRSGKVDHPARGQELVVRDLVWRNVDAYRSLWSYLARHDLVGRVRWNDAPVDDPAPELFIEPRMLNAVDREGAWFRIVDAPKALAGRGYDIESTLAIGIADDPLTPWNNGVWQVDAGPEGAEVRAGKATPDIALNAKALAALFTGFRSATQLSNWGLLSGEAAAVARADALFRTRYAPHCPDHF